MLFRSVRTYPISLKNPKGENVNVFPGQEIDLPAEFGLMFSGLLVPCGPVTTPSIKVEEKEVLWSSLGNVENEVIKDEEIKQVTIEEVKEVQTEEPVKKKAGRPKKNG